jgi:capsular polysaccharide biosynthesis protein
MVSLGDLLRVVWKRMWVILLVAVVLTSAAVGVSLGQTPEYEASIKILVGQKQGSDVPGSLGSDVMGLQQLTQTMADLISTRPVAEGVIRQLELRMSTEDFLENLSVEQVANTQSIQVSYKDPSPTLARDIANAVGDTFSERISEVSPSANAITATVWEPAVTPQDPVSPNPVRNGLLVLLVGLAFGVGLALVLEYLDDSWHSPEEVEQVSGVPTFGIISEFKVPKGQKKGG